MNIRLLIFLAFLLLAPVRLSAQLFNFDHVSVEAFIKDHKDVRSELIVRAAVEEGNAILHSWTNDTIKGYKTVNDLLDKYDRYFDMINLVISGACTVIHVKKSAETVSDRLSGMGTLMADFNRKCLSQGKIETSDVLILEIGDHMVAAIVDDVQELVKSLSKLLVYQGATNALGLTAMSTKNLIVILENINDSIDHIVQIVSGAYLKLRAYILARMGPFFRRAVYRSRSPMEIGTEALGRWMQAYQDGSRIGN